MAHVNAGQFNFYAQTSVLWNFWNFGGDHHPSRQTSSTGKSKKKDFIEHIPSHELKSGSLKELDKITKLPGLHYHPGFDQYAGYFTVNKEHNRNLFYWYVESQGNPATDPVIFWTNGGPGCSGIYAFAVEHGPFYINKNGKLFENPYSWNKRANMLYVESPAGVGYSFSDFKDDYKTGDAETALDNYLLIRQFLDRFPERQSNDFYISSESYGGHYMPQCESVPSIQVLSHMTASSYLTFFLCCSNKGDSDTEPGWCNQLQGNDGRKSVCGSIYQRSDAIPNMVRSWTSPVAIVQKLCQVLP
jgi:carboxypeptidase C (cathepsin A)